MAQAMVVNRARDRLRRIEEIHLHRFKEARARERFIEELISQIDEDYSKSRMLTEDELKKELGSVLG